MVQQLWGGFASKLAATPELLDHTIGVKTDHEENRYSVKLPYGIK